MPELWSRVFFLGLLTPLVAATNVWPAADLAYDDIEDIYTLNSGNGASGFTSEITPCNIAPFGLVDSGRQTAAEWIRTAFHDMATHNKTDGTGGLDASLQFELDRPENADESFQDTFGVIGVHVGSHRSLSDLVALALVLATKTCHGPSVPMRAGRIDAVAGGASGVPEPQQDLATHTAQFQRMGFTATEMITLVACGHTFGGVHEVDFPTIVPASEVTTTNTDGVQKFAKMSTYDPFDNHIPKEWIDGTTTNPLVTSFNETMHSDSRIFISDHNVTMKALARLPSLFSSQCSALFAKMIDTVPRGVQLTPAIAPYPVKPIGLLLTLLNETAIHLEGSIRLFDANPSAFAGDIDASITWKDRHSANCAGCSVPIVYNSSNPSTSLWGGVALAGVNATISTKHGISSYVVDYSTTSNHRLHATNGGTGFPLQDFVIWHAPDSCTNFQTSSIAVAIRNDAGEIVSPHVHWEYFASSGGIGSIDTELMKNTTLTSPSSLYTLYTATINSGHAATFTVGATVGGKKYAQSVDATVINYPFCF